MTTSFNRIWHLRELVFIKGRSPGSLVGDRSTENVPLNLNSLVSFPFFFCYLVSCILFLFIHDNLGKKFSLLHPLSFPLQCILFRSPFSLSLFINSLPICFRISYQKRQIKINATSISNVFVPCASPFFSFFCIEDLHSNKFRVATLRLYYALLNHVKLPSKLSVLSRRIVQWT